MRPHPLNAPISYTHSYHGTTGLQTGSVAAGMGDDIGFSGGPPETRTSL